MSSIAPVQTGGLPPPATPSQPSADGGGFFALFLDIDAASLSESGAEGAGLPAPLLDPAIASVAAPIAATDSGPAEAIQEGGGERAPAPALAALLEIEPQTFADADELPNAPLALNETDATLLPSKQESQAPAEMPGQTMSSARATAVAGDAAVPMRGEGDTAAGVLPTIAATGASPATVNPVRAEAHALAAAAATNAGSLGAENTARSAAPMPASQPAPNAATNPPVAEPASVELARAASATGTQHAAAAAQQAKQPMDRPSEEASARPQPVFSPTPNGSLPDAFRVLAPQTPAGPTPAAAPPANAGAAHAVPLAGPALAVEILSRLREGLRQFDVRLDPPELGRVDVRLEMDGRGLVKALLTVDRPETLDLLLREARGLERTLQQSGLKTEDGGMEFALRDQPRDQAADRRPQGANGGLEVSADDEADTASAAADRYLLAARARGGVDIRV